ncbi:hypothetical protein GCM10009839_62050 [Catenulispora yoronensis]|uniref:Uncharacterized protein n=1 Tax=Catenulispora yoronensis TaxID=450799 RepID=A0ABN2V2F5_9ACTN
MVDADSFYTVPDFAKPEAEQRTDVERTDVERAPAELATGRLTPVLHAAFSLENAAEAHTEPADRRTTGAVVLKPALS